MSSTQSPSTAAIGQAVDDLKRHAPFDAMDGTHLHDLAAALKLFYAPKGETVLPQGAEAAFLFIVQRGEVVGGGAQGGSGRVALGEGECFPVGALISRRASTLQFVAATDCFIYRLPIASFEHAMDVSRPFRDFATRRLASLLEQSQRRVQSHYSAQMNSTRDMSRPLKSLLRRAPRTAPPDASLRSVLQLMKDERIGSVIVTAATGEPLGIFTERDVLDRVALAERSLDTPVSAVMTPDPFRLPSHADALEAAQAMARHRFRHVLVMEEGRLAGVVSERDLFSLQRLTVGEVAKSIEQSRDTNELATTASNVRKLAASMLAQGVAAQQLTHLVTILNDAIVCRALELAGFPKADDNHNWCWMGLGSEGRMEQTLSTDQDNALIFAPSTVAQADSDRAAWLERCQRANALLDHCGFPLCKGGIMAGNPRWCLTLDEWHAQFENWLTTIDGEALLNAAIFFDCRPLAGNSRLAESLREWLRERAPRAKLFLREMAKNAFAVKPPLGLIRDFVVDDAEYPGTIDLKQLGARPFIDAARVFALQHGVIASNTGERIAQCARAMRMGDDERAALEDAFHFIQLQRLRSQEPSGETLRIAPNRIDPNALNELDRRILKEAFRQARKWQSRLELDFLQ